MNDARHNISERVRESGSNANTLICFEIRAHSSTFSPSHRSISIISSTQDFLHREPQLRIQVIQTGSTQLLSQQYNLYTRGKAQHKSPLHLEGWAFSQTRSTSHQRDKAQSQQHHNHLYTQRDTTTQLHNLLYTQRERHKAKVKEKVTTLCGLNKPQTNFLTKTRS